MTGHAAKKAVATAVEVQASAAWKGKTLADRCALVNRYITAVLEDKDAIAKEISLQMGKPLSQARGEVNGLVDRTRALIAMAPEALATEVLPPLDNLKRRIEKEPVGVVLAITPWNYPLLTTVNSVVPALLAGNAVVIKPSPKTPLTAVSAFVNPFLKAGAPEGIITSLNTSNTTTGDLIANPSIGFVSFTGSVATGRNIYKTVAKSRFIDATLELGGKDAAYVCEDADFDAAVATVVDGAFYNAGQSCCGIERVYVARPLYAKFLEAAKAAIEAYRIGDPMLDTTTLGPVALPQATSFLHDQVKEARAKGARVLTGGEPCTDGSGQGRFFQPTLVADCDNTMSIMTKESFGPVVAVAPVDSDAQAVALINDSEYGLTAAIFTKDEARANTISAQLAVGTVYMNRCDYLDPYLPWGGVKDTGKGVSLSVHGFRSVVRLKGYNQRIPKA